MKHKKLQLHNRRHKVQAELLRFNNDISETHRQEKFEKMSATPYVFFRGSNHLYWEDFFNDWRLSFFGGSVASLTWINGDAHIYNYGAYANHEGKAVFCMDDFDDSIIADYQFDLWRMAISIVLDCRDQGVFSAKKQRKALHLFAQSYLEEVIQPVDADKLDDPHFTKKTSTGLLKKFLKKVEKKKSREKMLNKWTKVEGDQRVFDLSTEKLEKISAAKHKQIEKALLDYQSTLDESIQYDASHYKVKDIAKRMSAGTGSLGSDRYYVLLEGDTSELADDVILDVKEQSKPPLYFHMSKEEQEEYDQMFAHEAELHARAFQALAEHPDRYLGWLELEGKFFSVKERSPFKEDFPTEKLQEVEELGFMANIWAKVLATRHKRASFILNDETHIFTETLAKQLKGREEEFVDLVTSIAFQYADCVAQDCEFLKELTAKA
jgi:uncharacterized protein (DUF2252 family)